MWNKKKILNKSFFFCSYFFFQLQSSYSTDDGCLVFPMDKPEQGFDLLQNAVNSVCGTEEHWFDYAIQMGPYEAFDYVKDFFWKIFKC